MSETGRGTTQTEALARLQRTVRPFKIERRMEDEPAHHEKALERLAEQDEAR